MKAFVVRQPLRLCTPVHIHIRFPDIIAATGKTEGLKAHGLQCHITREDKQITPGDLLAILLFDRPQQPSALVDIDVVWPGIERRKTLLPATTAPAPIESAVSAGSVPGHAHHLWTIVAEVSGPPVLAVGHKVG